MLKVSKMYSRLVFILWYAIESRDVLMKIIMMSKFMQSLRPSTYVHTYACMYVYVYTCMNIWSIDACMYVCVSYDPAGHLL